MYCNALRYFLGQRSFAEHCSHPWGHLSVWMSLVCRATLNSSFISCCENEGLFSAPVCVVMGRLAALPWSPPQGPRPRALGAGQQEPRLEDLYSLLLRLTAVASTQRSALRGGARRDCTWGSGCTAQECGGRLRGSSWRKRAGEWESLVLSAGRGLRGPPG